MNTRAFNMKKTAIRLLALCLLCCGTAALNACSSDDDSPNPQPPTAKGTFTDARDGQQYAYVTYDGLDWMAENFRYDIGDAVNSSIYLDADEYESSPASTRNLARYGRLYTLQGAQTACPEGWRIPTDQDWQRLEQALGMAAGEAAAEGWRGSIARQMLTLYGEQTDLNLLLGGYYFANTPGVQSGWRHMGVYAYYWTSTPDEQKDGTFYYVRKLTYSRSEVCRMSMEPTGYKLSVRYVRDAR